MTTSSTHTQSKTSINRRFFILAAMALTTAPLSAHAFTAQNAQDIIDRTVADLNALLQDQTTDNAAFLQLFEKYADVSVIARSALGPAARSANPQQLAVFEVNYLGYLTRKYTKQFQDFNGMRIRLTDVRQIKSYFEVVSIVERPTAAPLSLLWHISDKSGEPRFFNIIIEGVNMLASERREIGALLEKNRGNIDAMIDELTKI